MDPGGGSTRTELGDAEAEADDAIAKIMIRSPKVVVMWDVNCTRAGVWIRLIKRAQIQLNMIDIAAYDRVCSRQGVMVALALCEIDDGY